jgi:hypothetical protein
MGEAIYVEVPGHGTHELPPLLVRGLPEGTPAREELVELATGIVDSEDMLAENLSAESAEECKLNLAIHLADQYFRLMAHWQWGDSILEWIRQCEITFETHDILRGLLRRDLWPHAGRSSFVDLLVDKQAAEETRETKGVALEKAVGMRLTFRQPPPIDCFSNQFLFYLNSPLADTAYHTWSHSGARQAAHFPPSRFHFEILQLESIQ